MGISYFVMFFLLLFLAFSKELFFLNEELVLFFSFLILFSVLVELVVRFGSAYFDEEINSIHVRFSALVDKKIKLLNELIAFRLSHLEKLPLMKQVFLLLLHSLPNLSKFSTFVVYTFYSKLFSFFLALQLRLANDYLRFLLSRLVAVSRYSVESQKKKKKKRKIKMKKKFFLKNFGFFF